MDGRPPAGTSKPSGGQNPAYRPTARGRGPRAPSCGSASASVGRLCSGRLAEHPGDLRAALGALALGSEPAVGKFLLLTLELTLLAALDAVALVTRHAGSFLDASLRRPPVRGSGTRRLTRHFPQLSHRPSLQPGGGLW